MPTPEPPSSPEDADLDALAAEGAQLAAAGAAIADEMRTLLADAFAAVLADKAELGRLHPASARDAVDFLVRCGRMTREQGDVVVQRAGAGEGRTKGKGHELLTGLRD